MLPENAMTPFDAGAIFIDQHYVGVGLYIPAPGN